MKREMEGCERLIDWDGPTDTKSVSCLVKLSNGRYPSISVYVTDEAIATRLLEMWANYLTGHHHSPGLPVVELAM